MSFTVKAAEVPLPILVEELEEVVATFVDVLDKLLLTKANVPVPPRDSFAILTIGTLTLEKLQFIFGLLLISVEVKA